MISMSQISFKEMTKMFSGSAVLDWVELSKVYEYMMVIIVIIERGWVLTTKGVAVGLGLLHAHCLPTCSAWLLHKRRSCMCIMGGARNVRSSLL